MNKSSSEDLGQPATTAQSELTLYCFSEEGLTQSAFYVNLYRAVIGPSG